MNNRNVILSADSTCDLGEELKARYSVHYYPFHIILEGKQYQDNVDIQGPNLPGLLRQEGIAPDSGHQRGGVCGLLPPLCGAGFDVIHFCLGGALSSAQKTASWPPKSRSWRATCSPLTAAACPQALPCR